MFRFLKQSLRRKLRNLGAEVLLESVRQEKAHLNQFLIESFRSQFHAQWANQKNDLIRSWMEIQNPRLNPPDSFKREYDSFEEIYFNSSKLLPLSWDDRFPCLNDRQVSGGFDRHYILHTAWAARVLKRLNPSLHIDISSSLYFVSTVSAFIPIEFYDFNPVNLGLENVRTGSANLLSLHFSDQSIHSLSCMHVIEHVGLGRYGDPLDPDGDRKALQELKRVLAPNGHLLIVFPMGRRRIEYNAHRVYDLESALQLFSGLKIQEFVLIPDEPQGKEALVHNPSAEYVSAQNYACGCFLLKKAD